MQNFFREYLDKIHFFQLEDKDKNREDVVVDYLSQKITDFQSIFITGPMNAGKTSVLIQFMQKLGERAIAFSHINDRGRNGGNDDLVAWGKQVLRHKAKPYQSLQDILNYVIQKDITNKIILLEEVQFADNLKISEQLLQKFIQNLKKRKCKIVFAGLNTDFKKNIWPNAKLIFANVDKVLHLNTKCRLDNCVNDAFLNQLYINNNPATIDTDLVQIGKVGGKKLNFLPVCRNHHQLG